MIGWHHRLKGNEYEQTPGDCEGQGSLACCSPWGRKESDTTERLNNNNNKARSTGRERGFGQDFTDKIWEVGCWVCNPPLIGW